MNHGVVVQYDAVKGFGFVRSKSFGTEDVFVHASVVAGQVALKPGQRVRFLAESTEKGPRATRVEPGRRGLSPAMASLTALAIVLIAGTGGLVYSGKLSFLWAWLATISGVTFAIYGWDKHRAKAERRRVSELMLLGLALIGGTLGAGAAMLTFQHKTRKATFLIPFTIVIIIQTAALTWWFMKKS